MFFGHEKTIFRQIILSFMSGNSLSLNNNRLFIEKCSKKKNVPQTRFDISFSSKTMYHRQL